MKDFRPITDMKHIDTQTKEGKLLWASIAILKNRCLQHMSNAEILSDLNTKANHIFEDGPNKNTNHAERPKNNPGGNIIE